jgi:hypothetical protein
MLRQEDIMKTLIVVFLLSATLASCSGESQTQVANSNAAAATPTPAITPQVHVTPPVTNRNGETAPATNSAAAPVEFTFTGVTPDKESIAYKIKVNSAKPVSQVDIAVKYLDAEGRVVSETTRAWQNIVKSKKQPIEQGKTYEVTDELEPGSTTAECQLKRVFFTDGTNWSAP